MKAIIRRSCGDAYELPEGTNLNVKITYTGAAEGDKVYVIVAYKDGGSFTGSSAQIEVNLSAGDGETSASIPVKAFNGSEASSNLARLTLGLTANANWGSRIDVNNDSSVGNDAIFGTVIGDGSGAGGNDQLSITGFTWDDGSKNEYPVNANAEATVKIGYENAKTTDSLHLVLAYKGNAYSITSSVKFGFENSSGNAMVNVPTRALSDANNLRIHIGTEALATWGNRIDVNNDGAVGNDAIYALLVKNVTAVEQVNVAVVNVFPNPANDQLTIKSAEMGTIYVFNEIGVLTQTIRKNNAVLVIPLVNYARGIYTIQIVSKSGISTKRIVVSK